MISVYTIQKERATALKFFSFATCSECKIEIASRKKNTTHYFMSGVMLILNTELYNPASNSWGSLSEICVDQPVIKWLNLNNFGNVSYCHIPESQTTSSTITQIVDQLMLSIPYSPTIFTLSHYNIMCIFTKNCTHCLLAQFFRNFDAGHNSNAFQ